MTDEPRFLFNEKLMFSYSKNIMYNTIYYKQSKQKYISHLLISPQECTLLWPPEAYLWWTLGQNKSNGIVSLMIWAREYLLFKCILRKKKWIRYSTIFSELTLRDRNTIEGCRTDTEETEDSRRYPEWTSDVNFSRHSNHFAGKVSEGVN